MSVPAMQYYPAPVNQLPSFSPPMMAEVNRQVYELPPQPQQAVYSPTQPFAMPQIPTNQTVDTGGTGRGHPFTSIGAHDIELLQLHASAPPPSQPVQYQPTSRIANDASPVCTTPTSAFSGPPLENSLSNTSHIKRNRSMSCTSRQSDCSASYRHDPYAEPHHGDNDVYIESLGHRTPTPPPPLPGQQSPMVSPTDMYSPSFAGLLSLDPSFGPPQPHPQQRNSTTSPQQPYLPQGGYMMHGLERADSPSHLVNSHPQHSNYEMMFANNDSIASLSKCSTPEAQFDDTRQKAPKKKAKKEGRKTVCAMLVKFKHGREGEYYGDEPRKLGTHVIIEGQRGQDLGVVALARMVDNKPRAERRKRKVKRDATHAEVELWRGELYREEEQALSLMKHQVTKHNVPIVVHRAEYQFDRKKLTFHYTTKVSKPDFRAVLHDGFRHF
ncbi:hypothetical protein DIPPA_30472, partial [Diplonema papillatum]